MVTIATIGHTTETEGISAKKLREEQLILSGKYAGTCYAKDGYASIRTQPVEKAVKRAEGTAVSGHHSVFQHGMINMEILCPKMIAMLLNSIGVSNTSEKSARYTRMVPETEREADLYQKWHDLILEAIKSMYGERLSEKEMDKLAYENARYMISVFCETSMVYSLPFRNLFYVMDFTERMIAQLSKMEGGFNERLQAELLSLRNALSGVAGDALFHDIKNDFFRFLPVQATGFYDDDNIEYYGDVYTAKFLASFAQVAQEQRHRTTRVKINFGGTDAGEFGFYVPKIIRGTALEEEWRSDIESVSGIYPQGTLVSVTEQGLFEDFAVKCKERMCGRAQLEIMEMTTEMVKRFAEHPEQLSAANRKRLSDMLSDGKPCARCGYPDFVCREGCIWGKREALCRKI